MKNIITALSISLILSACGLGVQRTKHEADINYRVDMASFAHDVAFTNGAPAAAPAQLQRLNGFLSTIDIGYGDTISLSGGTPEQRRAVAEHLKPLMLEVRAYPDLGEPGAVTVTVMRHVVTAPACGDWSKPSEKDHANSLGPNVGCSTNAALAQMVANPADLLGGGTLQPYDSETEALGLRNFRAGNKPYVVLNNGGSGDSGGQ